MIIGVQDIMNPVDGGKRQDLRQGVQDVQHQALTVPASSIVDLLAMPGAEPVRFNPPQLRAIARAADLG